MEASRAHRRLLAWVVQKWQQRDLGACFDRWAEYAWAERADRVERRRRALAQRLAQVTESDTGEPRL